MNYNKLQVGDHSNSTSSNGRWSMKVFVESKTGDWIDQRATTKKQEKQVRDRVSALFEYKYKKRGKGIKNKGTIPMRNILIDFHSIGLSKGTQGMSMPWHRYYRCHCHQHCCWTRCRRIVSCRLRQFLLRLHH